MLTQKTRRKESERAHRRETPSPLAPLFICSFLTLGLPYVNWSSQECCLFYLRSSLPSSDLPLFYFCRLFPSDSVQPHRLQPTRIPHSWDSPGKNTGVGCHFLLQCMKVKSDREVAQLCPTLSNPRGCYFLSSVSSQQKFEAMDVKALGVSQLSDSVTGLCYSSVYLENKGKYILEV